jgi:integrase
MVAAIRPMMISGEFGERDGTRTHDLLIKSQFWHDNAGQPPDASRNKKPQYILHCLRLGVIWGNITQQDCSDESVAPALPQVASAILQKRMFMKKATGENKKTTLNVRGLNVLKPAPEGKRYMHSDVTVPGLAVQVTDKGQRSFVLVARFPGSANPTRRLIGQCGSIELPDARAKARDWLALISAGIDPAEQEERQRLEAQRRRKNTFAAVVVDFTAEKLSKERIGSEIEKELKREFIPTLGGRPITEITDDEIAAIIKTKARKAPTQARNMLATAKRFFQWAIDQRAYGLKSSPAAGLKPRALCGEKRARDRVLTEDEIAVLWRAGERLRYPYGPVYRLLLLTGLRLNEVADASRQEIDAGNKIWTIPAARMKGRNHTARPHVVPLTDEIQAILDDLPQFKRSSKNSKLPNYLFSTTFGADSVWMGDKIKKHLDGRMLRTLRALARRDGNDPAAVELVPWINHDIRRSVRSQLSSLKIPDVVCEAVLGHVRPGIKGVYDHHTYLDEKRNALELWAAKLRCIVEPAPVANVVPIAAARA